MCTNCSLVSHNLLNCDKCGCPFSADTDSVRDSAESPSHSISAHGGSVVRDEGVVINSSANATVPSRCVAPTPQGLFVNNSVNALTAASDTGAGVVLVNVQPQAVSVNRDNQVHTAVSASEQSIATRVVMVPSTATNQATLPTVNTDASARLSHPSVVGEIASLTSDHSASMSSATNGQLVSSNHQSGPDVTTEVAINAYQIRIGTRKFVPISPVSFKEDGIRFTLKGSFPFLCDSPFSHTCYQ